MVDVDLAAALCRIPHTGCHAECGPSVPEGRDGSGRICRECAVALAVELALAAGDEAASAAYRRGYAHGYEAGYERGWAACLRTRGAAQHGGPTAP